VFALPRTTGVESFLANLGALHLDGQDRVQDALLILVDDNINDGYGNVFFLKLTLHIMYYKFSPITEVSFSSLFPSKIIFLTVHFSSNYTVLYNYIFDPISLINKV
jgi:hypothetical protein